MTQLTLPAVQAQVHKVAAALLEVEAQHGDGARMRALHLSLGQSVDMLAAHFGVDATVIHPFGGTNKP